MDTIAPLHGGCAHTSPGPAQHAAVYLPTPPLVEQCEAWNWPAAVCAPQTSMHELTSGQNSEVAGASAVVPWTDTESSSTTTATDRRGAHARALPCFVIQREGSMLPGKDLTL